MVHGVTGEGTRHTPRNTHGTAHHTHTHLHAVEAWVGQQCRPLITAGSTTEGSCQVINTDTSNGRAAPHRVCGTNTTTIWISKQGCTPLITAGCDTLYRSGRVCEVFPPVAAHCWRRVLL